MKLAKFPIFSRLSERHLPCVTDYTNKFDFIECDFNFIGMWSWYNQNHKAAISDLNGNLVFKFWDPVRKKYFYSFIGGRGVDKCAKILKSQSIVKLELVPEKVALSLGCVKEQTPDYFDYVYSLESLSVYDGSKYKKQRNMVRKFLRENEFETRTMDVGKKKVKKTLPYYSLSGKVAKRMNRLSPSWLHYMNTLGLPI